MNKWYVTGWVLAVALAFGILLTGCVWPPDAQKWIAKSDPVVQTTNKSPWTQTIGENYQLTDCQETARRMGFAMKVHDILVQNMHDKITDEGQKQVVLVEIRALYEYVDELHTWMSDNCTEA